MDGGGGENISLTFPSNTDELKSNLSFSISSLQNFLNDFLYLENTHSHAATLKAKGYQAKAGHTFEHLGGVGGVPYSRRRVRL